MSRHGFTLLEMMMTVAILAIVMGVMMGLYLGIGSTASQQTAIANASEDARMAMENLAARLRSAGNVTINSAELPGDVLRFRPAMDNGLDGNGLAVGKDGRIEFGPEITVQPDVQDANGDGVSVRQLIMTQANRRPLVLCNSLPPESAIKEGGVPQVRGFWVAPRDGGFDVTIQTEGRDNRGRPFRVALTQFVTARN